MFDFLIPILVLFVVVIGVLFVLPSITLGLVIISERQVGIVVKRFARADNAVSAGKLIALNGEPGYQADTLSPAGTSATGHGCTALPKCR